MPFEVFNVFFRCSNIHKAHPNLQDAAVCFSKLTKHYAGNIPIDPISQKFVCRIAAIDRKGKQRNFSGPETAKAKALQLDPKSLETDIPSITTFSHLATAYYEASRLIPVSSIDLGAVLDRKSKRQHFWTTHAGIGQALAYAQQAAFTLELSLKACLEVLGKLASRNKKDIQKWKSHELNDLFDLLTNKERQQLEAWWHHSDTRRIHFKGTFQEFLSSCNKLYTKWRYITDLKSGNFSIDIPMLLSASDFLLSASNRILTQRSPIKINIQQKIFPDSGGSVGEPITPSVDTLVEGRVRTVRIPGGYDPFNTVELVIDSDNHEHDVIAHFCKRYVSDYYGLEGERVKLIGRIQDDQPNILLDPYHLDETKKVPKYTSEHLTLRGLIYDMRIIHSPFGEPGKVDLVLRDETFFTSVECFFVTDEERDKLTDLSLGDRILISGCVTLLNGEPTILVGPDHIEKVVD